MAAYDPNCAWYDFTCTKDPNGCAFWDMACLAATDINKTIAPTESILQNIVIVLVIGIVLVVGIIGFSPTGRAIAKSGVRVL